MCSLYCYGFAWILQVVLNMSCIPGISISGQAVTQVVGVCGLAYGRGGAALKSAAQSAASQTVAHLVKQLSEFSFNHIIKTVMRILHICFNP